MNDFWQRVMASAIMVLLTIGGVYLVVTVATPSVVVNQCPEPVIKQKVVKVEKATLEDGWECEKPQMTTDLLQPSGYWIGDTITCWKLDTPINEYRTEQCSETGDAYWCDPMEES